MVVSPGVLENPWGEKRLSAPVEGIGSEGHAGFGWNFHPYILQGEHAFPFIFGCYFSWFSDSPGNM